MYKYVIDQAGRKETIIIKLGEQLHVFGTHIYILGTVAQEFVTVSNREGAKIKHFNELNFFFQKKTFGPKNENIKVIFYFIVKS